MWWRVGLQDPVLVPVDYMGALYRRHAGSQLATTKMADRTRGHACLMERMASAFLERPELIAQYGDQLFWSCWIALTRARARGVAWEELGGLADGIRRIVQLAPRGSAVRELRSRFRCWVRALRRGWSQLVAGRQGPE